jgi:putative membrane protein
MRRTNWLWAAMAAVIIVVGCSRPESTTSSEQPAQRTVPIGTGGAGANVTGDAEFVQDVATKNMAGIELSRLAVEKATSPQIKAFAQQMSDDHGSAADALKTIVSGQGIDLPAQLDEKHRETADDLSRKQGADFDRDYLGAVVEGHQDLAAKLESRLDVRSVADWKTAAAGRAHSKALPDPKVEMRDVAVRPARSDSDTTMKINQWAADTYPIAQKHLDTARTLQNATKKRSTN